MDDMTLTTKTVVEGRWLLEELESTIHWARMSFKPGKSRSMVLKKGKLQQTRFRVQGEIIPTVTESPIKCLGKWYDQTLKDHDHVRNVKKQLEKWMTSVDKSKLPGKYKAWIFQHGVLPRLLWPLLIYEMPLSAAEEMQVEVTKFLRRWFGVPRSFSSIGFYATGNKLQLPIRSVVEEIKVTKVRQQITLKESNNTVISEAEIRVRAGRKWNAGKALDEARWRLQQKEIVGAVAHGKLGIG
jgi:hypothetical protein